MSTERESLIAAAEAKGIVINKFWNTKKLAVEVTLEIAKKDRRSDTMRRAWVSRRSLFGPTGYKSAAAPEAAANA